MSNVIGNLTNIPKGLKKALRKRIVASDKAKEEFLQYADTIYRDMELIQGILSGALIVTIEDDGAVSYQITAHGKKLMTQQSKK